MSDMSITVIYPAMSLTVLYLAKLEYNKKIAHCCNSSKISLKIVDKEAHTYICRLICLAWYRHFNKKWLGKKCYHYSTYTLQCIKLV